MNETFARILQFTLIFWVLLGLFSTIFAERMGTFIIDNMAENDLKEGLEYDNIQNIGSGLSLVFNIMTFQVTEFVPIWVTAILDIIAILTGFSLLMLVFNR